MYQRCAHKKMIIHNQWVCQETFQEVLDENGYIGGWIDEASLALTNKPS